MASDLTSDILKSGSPVFEEESDIEVAEQSGLAMLKTLEVFHRHNPENENFLLLLTKSYGTYAFGFLENHLLQYQDVDPRRYETYLERAKLFYSRGKEYGLQLIEARDRRLHESIGQGVEPLRRALEDSGEIEGLFWTAFNWGGYINLTKDSVKSVSDLVLVEAIMGRCLEMRPRFFYAGPHLFYGVYYASRPPMLGGSPEKARTHFEAAAKLTEGRFLMAYALQAQFLAPQTLDETMFREVIQKVEEGSVDALPEQRLANVLAKERVRLLKENQGKYF